MLTEPEEWCEEVRAALERTRPAALWISRIHVVEEAASTQDVARDMADEGAGLVVVARRQTNGRGRLGRAWEANEGKGLAATFVIGAAGVEAGRLSIVAGLGACMAIEKALGVEPREADAGRLDWLDAGLSPGLTAPLDVFDMVRGRGQGHVGLRWPNDVVRLEADRAPGAKLAGVLIERVEGKFLVGIGVNVLQRTEDWPDELQERAVSLRQLGSRWNVADAAAGVALGLEAAMRLDDAGVLAAWAARDVLYGRRCTFESAGNRYTGRVVRVNPTSEIEIMDEARGPVRLVAERTTLIGA